MPNQYDKVLRENIEEVILPLSGKYFGFEIVEATELQGKLQLTTEREPDFLKLVKTADGAEFILHLEFQTQNDPRMIYRMQTYHALLMEMYGREIRQFVLYLGSGNMRMRTKLKTFEIMRGFEVVNIKEIDHREMLASTVPEEIILAILGDFQGKDPNAVVRLLLQRLMKVGEDDNAVRKAMQQLGILSRLRKLDSIVEHESEDMPIAFDITKDRIYNKGVDRGVQQGIVQGGQQKARNVVSRMLKAGETDTGKISNLVGLPVDEVKEIARKYWENSQG